MKTNRFFSVSVIKFTIFSLIMFTTLLNSCQKEPENVETKQTFVLSDKMLSSTKTAVSKMDTVKNQLVFFGKIATDNNKLVEIFPIVGGNVTHVYVELGDYVQKGQLLATIQSTEVASFEKDLEDAQNDLMLAKNKQKIAQDLFNGKLNTERDVIEAKAEVEKAQSQLNRVQEFYKVYSLKKNAIYEVRSPLNGFITEKDINEGMLLRSDKTDNIFDVSQIDVVWAIANVTESDISKVRLGYNAEVTTLSYPDKVFYGQVDKIFNVIDPDTKAMKIRVTLNNKDFMLKPDMRATIKLSFNENNRMLTIPADAIVFDKSKNYVVVFKDKNNIEVRQVEIYRQVGDVAYIQGGLKEGEKVMITNQLLVYNAFNE